MKKLLFVINPHSGRGEISSKLLSTIDLFVQHGYEVTIHTTQGQLDAYQQIKKRAQDFDLIVCSGGDGTLHESVAGLIESGTAKSLGYLPAGTVNDFAASLSLPRDMLQAAHTVMEGTPFLYDIGSFNQTYFSYVAAFGLFTDVAYQTPQHAKNMLGRLAYFLEGIKRLSTIAEYHLDIHYDDGAISDDFIFGMITNSTSVAGLQGLAPKDVRLDDGLFEVVLVKKPTNPLEMQQIINVLLLNNTEPKSELIHVFKTAHLSIKASTDMPWTLDGEYGGAPCTIEIQNCQQALTIIN